MAASTVPVITVDGPSGTGKGTICSLLADWLGWHLLDSGALYRVTALAVLRAGVDVADVARVGEIAAGLELDFAPGGAETPIRILLAREDVSAAIRAEQVSILASEVAAYPAVRSALLARQHASRRAPGLIADGRDMGTVVFPDAPLKFFLTASAGERAERRYKQLKLKGIDVNLRQLSVDIAERDARDSQRKVSPLTPASDAVVIDTTGHDIDAVLAIVSSQVQQRFTAVPTLPQRKL
ncbi:MAG: (d)CMP kinase [Gammaproteobacteria bacterium]